MSEIGLQEFVDEIYEDSKRNDDTKYIFFLGAGCSKSSGIPLAGELAKEWYEKLKKQKTKFDNFNIKYNIKVEEDLDFASLYFNIFESLFPTPLSQQKAIQEITEGKSPGSGYYTLASLMKIPSFNTVITTNFDNLIQDALIYSGDKRALVITHQDLAKFIERNNTPLIVKVHGDSHMDPCNNSDNTKIIPYELNDAIQGLFINTKLVFIGYSGSDKSIRNLLIDSKRIDHVYWLSSNIPSKNKLSKWWKNTTSKTFVNERDFDKIMNLIKSRFSFSKPDFSSRAKELEESYDDSIKEENKEIEIIENKTEIDYFILGNNYFDTTKYEKAIESYKKAIEINPEYYNAYNNLGYAYFNRTKYEKAIEAYSNAIKINPKDSSAYYNLGNAYYYYKKYPKAIEAYSNAIKINPKDSSVHNNIGNTYLKMDKYEKAIESYLKVIEINPEDSLVYNNLGIGYGGINEYKKAIESYEKAIEINQENKSSYINLLELEIIQKITLEEKFHKKYVSLLKQNNVSLIKYDMLKILKSINKSENYSINEWSIKYKDERLEDWYFNNLDAWVLKQKPDIKNKLLAVMKVFKSKLEKK